jgi:hypothetical protein
MKDPAKNRVRSIVVLGYAGMAQLFAVGLALTPLATGDYRGMLLMALGLTLPGVSLSLRVIRRGETSWGKIAVLLMLPTLFVIWDFVRRAPAAFFG